VGPLIRFISVPASIPIVFCWACSKPTADLCA
jgi:hypothetical protein